MVMMVFCMLFNFWWLSYWLGQGSGVSAMWGWGAFLWTWVEWGNFLFLGAPWVWIREAHGKPSTCPCHTDERGPRGNPWDPKLWGSLPAGHPVFTEQEVTCSLLGIKPRGFCPQTALYTKNALQSALIWVREGKRSFIHHSWQQGKSWAPGWFAQKWSGLLKGRMRQEGKHGLCWVREWKSTKCWWVSVQSSH